MPPLGPSFVKEAASKIAVTDGAFLFAAIDSQGDAAVGSSGVDGAGRTPTATDSFRIGSITKVFTAATVLTLVDNGTVDLGAQATCYLDRVPVAEHVTVRDLLRHTSGIYNVTDHPDFSETIFGTPDRRWTPEEVVALATGQPPLFTPGSMFSYSNTNYVILGVLIEELTARPYHEVLREQILKPLDLSASYMAGFENGPEVFDPYQHEGQPHYDYTSVASWSWTAGGLVSSARDLHVLFTALFDNQIVSGDLVAQMIDGVEYGLGLELFDSHAGLFGHGGSTPGYRNFVRHSPESGVTAYLASTDSTADTRYANDKLLEGFAAISSRHTEQSDTNT